MQLHVLGDLSEAHDQPAFRFGFGGILLVDPLLEADQLLQQQSHALIDFLTQDLVTIPAEGGGEVTGHRSVNGDGCCRK